MADWPYNTAVWTRLRKAHLAIEPLYRHCTSMGRLTPANHVDHVVPISAGGDPFPGHDGLASLCTPCHSAKTAARQVQCEPPSPGEDATLMAAR